ncbi:MAG: hypothetical protein DRP57_05580 [Spirochaetes bacterium]|nr:MAG: hypothetical protein DRP57_05580 [Spirochaetota bacterium]
MNIKNYLKYIFPLNALIDAVIGTMFLFLSEKTEYFLFGSRVFPHYLWVIIGAAFLYFAYWQIRSTAKGKTGRNILIFASAVAWILALVLAVILIIHLLPLTGIGKIVLLAVDICMILLGTYYLLLLHNTTGNPIPDSIENSGD